MQTERLLSLTAHCLQSTLSWLLSHPYHAVQFMLSLKVKRKKRKECKTGGESREVESVERMLGVLRYQSSEYANRCLLLFDFSMCLLC